MFAIYLILFLICRLLCRKARYATPMAIALSAVLLSLTLDSPIGLGIVRAFNPEDSGKDFAMSILERTGLAPPVVTRAPVVPVEEARAVASQVLKLKELWSIPLRGSFGTPHMTLGVRYGGIFSGGKFQKTSYPSKHSAILWHEFGTFYEQVRTALSREIGSPVRLLPKESSMWPPSFNVHLSNVMFTHPSDVHCDSLIPEHMQRLLMAHLASHGTVRCHWSEQQTLIVPLRAPSPSQNLTFAIDLYEIKRDSYGVCGSGSATEEQLSNCVEKQTVPYTEGRIVMFPSKTTHSSTPWRHVAFDIGLRVLMTAFVVPCEVNGSLEYELFGAVGR